MIFQVKGLGAEPKWKLALLGGAFVVLAVVWGVLNPLITRLLWFPMRKGWKVYLSQGTVLFITFFLANYLPIYEFVPLLLEFTFMEQVLAAVILSLLYAFLDGYVAKSIAGHWKVRGVQTEALTKAALLLKEPEIKANNPDEIRCPRCHGVNLVVAADKSAYCMDCKRGLRRETMGGTAG